jgi:allantoinase
MDHVQAHDKVWVCTREEIARHWMAGHPAKSGG